MCTNSESQAHWLMHRLASSGVFAKTKKVYEPRKPAREQLSSPRWWHRSYITSYLTLVQIWRSRRSPIIPACLRSDETGTSGSATRSHFWLGSEGRRQAMFWDTDYWVCSKQRVFPQFVVIIPRLTGIPRSGKSESPEVAKWSHCHHPLRKWKAGSCHGFTANLGHADLEFYIMGRSAWLLGWFSWFMAFDIVVALPPHKVYPPINEVTTHCFPTSLSFFFRVTF